MNTEVDLNAQFTVIDEGYTATNEGLTWAVVGSLNGVLWARFASAIDAFVYATHLRGVDWVKTWAKEDKDAVARNEVA